MIYYTGDLHSNPTRLSTTTFPQQKTMSKNDIVIVTGDFGIVWAGDKTDNYWLNWLETKPFTTVFVDGNHENFDLLNNYPTEMWHGGKVHKIRPSVIHLMRGQVYNINGQKYFTMGGASSHDIDDGILEPDDTNTIKDWRKHHKQFRVNHVDWWAEELPSDEEIAEARANLEKNNWNVDYIITHCPPSNIKRQLNSYDTDKLSEFLQEVKNRTDYKFWIFGHMHEDKTFMYDRCECVYTNVKMLPYTRDIPFEHEFAHEEDTTSFDF